MIYFEKDMFWDRHLFMFYLKHVCSGSQCLCVWEGWGGGGCAGLLGMCFLNVFTLHRLIHMKLNVIIAMMD